MRREGRDVDGLRSHYGRLPRIVLIVAWTAGGGLELARPSGGGSSPLLVERLVRMTRMRWVGLAAVSSTRAVWPRVPGWSRTGPTITYSFGARLTSQVRSRYTFAGRSTWIAH